MQQRRLSAYMFGALDYDRAHALQRELVEARAKGHIDDVLLLLEHEPVITLGRGAKRDHVLQSQQRLRTQGVELREVGRGGDVTYHGPGQLVGYPIVDLKPDRCDVRQYVRMLEQTMIDVCGDYSVCATREPGLNGAWVGQDKIGAVGVRISRWITMHGFALNVNTALDAFSLIVPCGIRDRGVTSLSQQLGRPVSLQEASERAAVHFSELLDARLGWGEASDLEGAFGSKHVESTA